MAPLKAHAFGIDLWTIPPNSQGYLTLAAAELASRLDLPADPNDVRFAHLLIEAATAAGFDRPQALSDTADGDDLLKMIALRLDLIDPDRVSNRWAPAVGGRHHVSLYRRRPWSGRLVDPVQRGSALSSDQRFLLVEAATRWPPRPAGAPDAGTGTD